MATGPTAAKSEARTEGDGVSREIEAELAQLRKDVAAIAKTLTQFGRLTTAEAAERVHHLSGEMLGDSAESLKDVRLRLAELEKTVETNVREHPLSWFLGALGLGALLALLLRRP